MLKDLTIENYRLFRKFTLDSIARVNLIVGTNNCGKSSLLEAVYLLTGEGIRSRLLDILDQRGEFVYFHDRGPSHGKHYQVSHIFHRHQLKPEHSVQIRSKREEATSLTISYGHSLDESKSLRIPMPVPTSINDEGAPKIFIEYNRSGVEPTRRALRLLEEDLLLDREYTRKPPSLERQSRLITTQYLDYDELAKLWDDITLTPREDKVVEALRILEPEVERISFTSRQSSSSGILLRLSGEEDPIPLGSTGDGMRRVLAVAASMVTVENGTLLIDEIDTGLYYQVLTNMWRLILETAVKRNVQVFATTHSWDCVRSFQEALMDVPDQEPGLLIRLDRRDDRIHAVSYSRDELGIAIRENIEVR